MSTIKNFRVLVEKLRLSEKQINRLEAGANMHKRFSNIEFKIIKLSDSELEIQVKQGKHLSKNYATDEILIQRTEQLFRSIVPENIKMNIIAIPFKESEIVYIDANWLENKMRQANIRVKDIADDTGLDNTNISAWVNNKRPMSQIVKALFYFYFLEKISQSSQSNTNEVKTQDSKRVKNVNSNDKNASHLKGLSGQQIPLQPNKDNDPHLTRINVISSNSLDKFRSWNIRKTSVMEPIYQKIFVDRLSSLLRLNCDSNILNGRLRIDSNAINKCFSLGVPYLNAYFSLLMLRDRNPEIPISIMGINTKNDFDLISLQSRLWLIYETIQHQAIHPDQTYSFQNNNANGDRNNYYAEVLKYFEKEPIKGNSLPYFYPITPLYLQEHNNNERSNENDMFR